MALLAAVPTHRRNSSASQSMCPKTRSGIGQSSGNSGNVRPMRNWLVESRWLYEVEVNCILVPLVQLFGCISPCPIEAQRL